jgi:DtxR family transcriptional regulator, Mn-dependent transcriptional regulator
MPLICRHLTGRRHRGVSDLIDTTEMYLRTVYELQEEGIVPMRARIAERLGQSGPTVSQTVARMERDGLLVVLSDRHLEFTPSGREAAVRVMRKHRLAECLLVDVLGMPWEEAHAEACRWEHVMSESVERRVVALLDNPTQSPYGNAIPGLDDLMADDCAAADARVAPPARAPDAGPVVPLTGIARPEPRTVVVCRIAEPIQDDAVVMAALHRVAAMPGMTVRVEGGPAQVRITGPDESADFPAAVAMHVMVRPGEPA